MCISNDTEQLLDTLGADRRDNAKLGEMGTNGIYHRNLLADEEMARAVEHQAALLLRCLGRDEPHVRPGDRFADCLGISGIVLVSLDVGLHIGWRHQAHGMAKCLELARPMMRRGARLDADQVWRYLLEEGQDVATLQLAADDRLPACINAVHLKD